VDYIAKPGGTISLSIARITEELVAKVRAAARSRFKGKASVTATVARRMQEERRKVAQAFSSLAEPRGAGDGLLVIGASTGGPRALEIVLSGLPENFPWPVLVAQHMPAAFTRAFADRLNQICALHVVEAGSALPVEAGKVYIGRGGADMVLASRAGKLTILPMPENSQFLWHPSVELLGRSVLEHYDPKRVTAVLLTGMGYDGSDAFAEIKARRPHHCRIGRIGGGLRNAGGTGAKGGASLILAVEKVAAQLSTWASR
jgi:two-component system chemotaxis response regulator CheB